MLVDDKLWLDKGKTEVEIQAYHYDRLPYPVLDKS